MARDRGHYKCRFTNEVGEVESNMDLRVEHTPMVTHSHNRVAAAMGERIEVACTMMAYPQPRFSWSFRKSPIQNSDARHRTDMRATVPATR